MAWKNKEEKKEYSKQYKIDNKEKIAIRQKKYYKEHKKKIAIRQKKLNKIYYKEHREERREYFKKYNEGYYQEHKEKIKEYSKEYFREHKEEIAIKAKMYSREHTQKEEVKKRRNAGLKNRAKTDLKYNLNIRISTSIRQSLKGNKAGRAWESLTGYTLADLIKRLKKTMPVGYAWKDVLNGKLHIEHKTPIKVFNFARPEHTDFKRCFALSNLRLLPARENIVKSDKLYKPFQPALQI